MDAKQAVEEMANMIDMLIDKLIDIDPKVLGEDTPRIIKQLVGFEYRVVVDALENMTPPWDVDGKGICSKCLDRDKDPWPLTTCSIHGVKVSEQGVCPKCFDKGTQFESEVGQITVYCEPEDERMVDICDICGGRIAEDATCPSCIERYERCGIDPDCLPLACPVHGTRLDNQGFCMSCKGTLGNPSGLWRGAY